MRGAETTEKGREGLFSFPPAAEITAALELGRLSGQSLFMSLLSSCRLSSGLWLRWAPQSRVFESPYAV